MEKDFTWFFRCKKSATTVRTMRSASMRPAITSTIESTLTALTSSPERVTEGKEQDCQHRNLIALSKPCSVLTAIALLGVDGDVADDDFIALPSGVGRVHLGTLCT